MKTIVFTGKDCRVVYQNPASRVFHNRSSVGVRAIGIRAGEWSIEAMRDRVWRGELFSIIDKTIPLGTSNHRQLVLRRRSTTGATA